MTKCNNIVHVTEYFRSEGYGVFTAIAELSGQLSRLGIAQEIISSGSDAATPPSGVRVYRLPIHILGKPWSYPVGFDDVFDEITNPRSVVHLHGIWKAPQFLAAKRASLREIPAVLSPHNMLGEWFWRDGLVRQIKKKVYWKYFSSPRFEKVAAIHALNRIERDVLCRYFPKQRVEIIPNGIDVVKIDRCLSAAAFGASSPQEKYILIFGRLHPVKGIDMFIKTYSKIPVRKRIPVIIAGPPHTGAYFWKLQKLVHELELDKTVSFIGPVSGHEKWNLLRNAWVLCAPSYSEGLSMVALEAMSSKVPIITTHAAGIPDAMDGGGLLIEPRIEELEAALLQALSWSDAERLSRAQAARHLIQQNYAWDVIGPQYIGFYRSLR